MRKRRQRNPPHAVRKALRGFGCRLQREPGLAGTARTRQGEKRHVVSREERDDLGEFPFAPDECGRRDRQVVPVEAAERWEVPVTELIEADRRREVLETMLAEVPEVDTVVEKFAGAS